MNKIERLIADAEEATQEQWVSSDGTIYAKHYGTITEGYYGSENGESRHNVRHIANLQPSTAIPLLKAFLAMREALGIITQEARVTPGMQLGSEEFTRYIISGRVREGLFDAIETADKALENIP